MSEETDYGYEDGIEWDTDHDCEHCGENSLCAYAPDPYLLEAHGERRESWWCYRCWSNRAEEV